MTAFALREGRYVDQVLQRRDYLSSITSYFPCVGDMVEVLKAGRQSAEPAATQHTSSTSTAAQHSSSSTSTAAQHRQGTSSTSTATQHTSSSSSSTSTAGHHSSSSSSTDEGNISALSKAALNNQVLLEVLVLAATELEQGRGTSVSVVEVMDLLSLGMQVLPSAEWCAFVAARGSLLLQVLSMLPRVLQQVEEKAGDYACFMAPATTWCSSHVDVLYQAYCKSRELQELGKLATTTGWQMNIVIAIWYGLGITSCVE